MMTGVNQEIPMPPAVASRPIRFARHEMPLPSERLGLLREANALLDDPDALRERLATDGYLFIRGLHDPDQVLQARQELLERIAASGKLDPNRPLLAAGIPPAGRGAFFGKTSEDEVKSAPAFQALVRSPRLLRFFSELFATPAMTYDFQWLRLVGTGDHTGAHLDNVYMGRGSARLHTVWTPIGDCPAEQGTLAIAVGSHRAPGLARVRETYGRMDVDRDRVSGWFADDPLELSERFGVQWATADFRAGDALVFGMFTLHASLTNTTDRFRLSCDTRYQPAADPADERWIGATPKGHYGWNAGPQVAMAVKRQEWGV